MIKALRKAGVSEEKLNILCGKKVNEVFGFNLPITVPSDEKIDEVLAEVRKAYPFDAFADIT